MALPQPQLGRMIREARERTDMTQQQLADLVGRSRGAVNAWENGRAVPMRSIARLEDVLGISLREPDQFRPVSPELRRLIKQTLPGTEDQRRVIGLLEGTLTWPDAAGPQPQDAPESRRQAE